MVVSIILSLLSFLVAAAALWSVYEINNKQRHRRQELINDHAVEITRLQNAYNDEIGRLKQQHGILDDELQTFRQEFRQATRLNRMEIDKLNVYCERLGHGWNETEGPREKPSMS